MTRYFHGGYPGLKPGDHILPPDLSGTDRRLSSYAAEIVGADHPTARTDVVYLTTERNVARAYAAFYPDGALYQALPVGPVEPDPVVLFRTRRPKRWLRALAGATT